MMKNEIRLHYLQAMGIDVWVVRKRLDQITDDEISSTQSIREAAALQPVGLEITNAVNPEVSHRESIIEPELPKTDVENDELILSTDNQDITGVNNSIDEWTVLQKRVETCQQCELYKTRTQTVFGSGNLNADWMFVGEAPGKDEDAMGQPFVGVAGKLLTEMIRAMGLERDTVYITNILKCRPPNNRNPQGKEISSCHEYLQQQIELVKPKIMLAVGRIAAQALLGSNESLSKLRGRPHIISGIPLIVVYHPAYLLRSLLEKRKAWQDLQLALNIYQNLK